MSSGASSERISELAGRSQQQAERALERLRETVRGSHPRELSDLGLAAAVNELAARSPLQVRVSTRGEDDDLSSPVAGAVYFVVSEALTNVAKHTAVLSADVELLFTGSGVVVVATVHDDGPGGARVDAEGTGLAGLRERMRSLGGDLVVASGATGTTITATAPREPTWKMEEAR